MAIEVQEVILGYQPGTASIQGPDTFCGIKWTLISIIKCSPFSTLAMAPLHDFPGCKSEGIAFSSQEDESKLKYYECVPTNISRKKEDILVAFTYVLSHQICYLVERLRVTTDAMIDKSVSEFCQVNWKKRES